MHVPDLATKGIMLPMHRVAAQKNSWPLFFAMPLVTTLTIKLSVPTFSELDPDDHVCTFEGVQH